MPSCRIGGRPLIIAARYDSLWVDGSGVVTPVMWEWSLDLGTGRVGERQLDDTACEFPRIDNRLTGLPAATGYARAELAVGRRSGLSDQLRLSARRPTPGTDD